MTTNTAHKRLDELETHLTPKEWAIWLADETRKYPTILDYTNALAKLPLDELPPRRPYFALRSQAEKQHPGHKPEDIRARHRLAVALGNEYEILKQLLRCVNVAMLSKVESINLQASLQLSALHTLILQDAFGQAAARAAALVSREEQGEMTDERRALLKELGAFTEADRGEPPPGGVEPKYAVPAPVVEWTHEFTALLKDFYAHRSALKLVQDQYFDGHAILFLDVEAPLNETARTIESAIATANEYLRRRTERGTAITSEGMGENSLAIGLESIKARARGQWATAVAEKWLRDARFDATEDESAQWEQWREEHAEDGNHRNACQIGSRFVKTGNTFEFL